MAFMALRKEMGSLVGRLSSIRWTHHAQAIPLGNAITYPIKESGNDGPNTELPIFGSMQLMAAPAPCNQLALVTAPGRECSDCDFSSDDEGLGPNTELIKFLMDKGYPLYKNWSDQHEMNPYDQGELGICMQVSHLGAVENSLMLGKKIKMSLSLEDFVLYTHIALPKSQDEKTRESNREANREILGQIHHFMKDSGILSADGKHRVQVGNIEVHRDFERLFEELQTSTTLSPIYASRYFGEVEEEVFSGDEDGRTSGSDNSDDDFECVPGFTTNHMLEIIGYHVPLDDPAYAIVRNSYGRWWGKEGVGKVYFGVNGFAHVFWVISDVSVVESSSVVPHLIPVKKEHLHYSC